MQVNQSSLRLILIIIAISEIRIAGGVIANNRGNKELGLANKNGASQVNRAEPNKVQMINQHNKNDIFKPIINDLATKVDTDDTEFNKKAEGKISSWLVSLKNEIKAIFGIRQPQAEQPKARGNKKAAVIEIKKPKVVFVSKNRKNVPNVKNHQNEVPNFGLDQGAGAVVKTHIMKFRHNTGRKVNESKIDDQKVNEMIDNARNVIRVAKPAKQVQADPQNLNIKKNGLESHNKIKEDTDKVIEKSEVKRSVREESEPIQIVWEVGSLKTEFPDSPNKANEFNFLKKLMSKADSLLKMYVHIPKEKQRLINLPKGKRCGFDLPQDIVTNAHVLMLCRFFVPKNDAEASVVARSIYCQKDGNNRAMTGVLEINIKKLVSENAPLTLQKNFITTLVHEVMHTLAFHGDWKKILMEKDIKNDHKNLHMIKKVKPEIWEEGHWQDPYILNDIMTPVTSSAGIMSIFSLEILEHQSHEYLAQRKNLPYNNFISTVTSVEDFLSYKCTDPSQKPKYNEFCSLDEVKEDVRKCSADYVHKTYCDPNVMSNKCFLRRTHSQNNCLDTVVDPQYENYPFEHRGSDARCFTNDFEADSYCLRYEVADQKINILIGEASYTCESDGQLLSVKYKKQNKKGSYNFTVKCPVIADFIDQNNKTSCPNNCHWNGFCSKGQCLCFEGYDSKDNCKTQLKTVNQTMIFTETMA